MLVAVMVPETNSFRFNKLLGQDWSGDSLLSWEAMIAHLSEPYGKLFLFRQKNGSNMQTNTPNDVIVSLNTGQDFSVTDSPIHFYVIKWFVSSLIMSATFPLGSVYDSL